MKRCLIVCLVLLFPALAAAQYLPDGGVDRSQFARFADLGSALDFDAKQDVFFPPPPVNYQLWGNTDAKYFIRYENPSSFYWVTKPRSPERFTSARVIKNYYQGVIDIRALAKPAREGKLAIRYKDNLLQPASVWVRGQAGWRQIGELGGKFDHQWKVVVLPFDTGEATIVDGAYRVRLSRGDYGDMRGDLPVDWVGLAPHDVAVPASMPGFWPAKTSSRFYNLAQTMEYVPGEGPKLLAGVLVKGMRLNSWKRYHEMYVNSIIFQGWETIWTRKWEKYSSGKYADRVRYGFPDYLDECKENKLLCTSQFFTDTRSYFIERQYGGEENVLDTLYQVMKLNRGHPGNLCWYTKDEADHNDETWGSPPEFILQLYNLAKEADPSRPVAVLFQGWKPASFAMFDGAFDIAAFDVYPLGADRPVTEISDRIERMRSEVGPSKALWAVIEAHEGEHERNRGRQLTKEETLVQGYLCLAHDIHGIFYYIGNEATFIDLEEMPGPTAGMSQFFKEVNGPGGIAPYFLPGAETIARTGQEQGRVAIDSDAVHFIYKRKGTTKFFLAVNTSVRMRNNLAMKIEGLPPGATVKVLFENRTLTASAEGTLIDNFNQYERHVYLW